MRWDADFGGEGVLVVRNLGRDTAYNVLIRAIFDGGEPHEVEAAKVGRSGQVQIDLPAVRERLERDRREDTTPTPGLVLVNPMRMYPIDIEATWQSESGGAYQDGEVGGTWSSLEP